MVMAMAVLMPFQLLANVVITPATNGNNQCVGGGFITLSPAIQITEGALAVRPGNAHDLESAVALTTVQPVEHGC